MEGRIIQGLMDELAGLWVEVIGLFAGMIGVVVGPQGEFGLQEDMRYLSLPTFGLIATALSVVIYGVLIRSLSIILANLAALGCISLIILGVIRLRGREAIP